MKRLRLKSLKSYSQRLLSYRIKERQIRRWSYWIAK